MSVRGSVDVYQFLIERDVPHEFFRLDGPISSVAEIPGTLGLNPAEVVAVRAFEGRAKLILALVGVDLEPSLDLVAEAARVPHVRMARPATVSRITGFPAEWAPPVAHERSSTVLIDKNLLAHDIVYAPAGEPSLVLKLRSEDLLGASGAVPALLGEPGAISS